MSVTHISHKSSTKKDKAEASPNIHVSPDTGKVTVSCEQRQRRMDITLCDHYNCDSRLECQSYRKGLEARAKWHIANGGTPMENEKIVEIECKYHFTDPEKKELSDAMAQQITEKIEVEQEKKQTSDNYNKQIKELEAQIYAKAARVHNGFEWRNMECREEKDYEAKRVRYVRIDTQEVVKEREMSGSDFELDLPIQ